MIDQWCSADVIDPVRSGSAVQCSAVMIDQRCSVDVIDPVRSGSAVQCRQALGCLGCEPIPMKSTELHNPRQLTVLHTHMCFT